MKIKEINIPKTTPIFKKIPTPKIEITNPNTHATRDAGLVMSIAAAGLAIACIYYGCRDRLKAGEKKAQDAAALIQKDIPDAALIENANPDAAENEASTCKKILGYGATKREIEACKQGMEEGLKKTAKELF